MPAVEIGIRGDRVANGEGSNAGADLHDLAGDLVTDDAREMNGQPSGLDMLDGQPRAAGQHARNRFARSGNGIGQLGHFEWRVGAPQNQGFHEHVPRRKQFMPQT